MNIANKFTLSRLFITILFLIFFSIESFETRFLALIFLLAGSATDTLDGIIARRKKIISDVGIILDPIVDKILISVVYILFLGVKYINVPAWAVAIVVAREMVITAMRLFALSNGTVMSASKPGKYKMTIQSIAAIFITIVVVIIMFFKTVLYTEPHRILIFIANDVVYYLTIIIAMFTLFTGIHLLYQNRHIFINTFRR